MNDARPRNVHGRGGAGRCVSGRGRRRAHGRTVERQRKNDGRDDDAHGVDNSRHSIARMNETALFAADAEFMVVGT
jgi:hypothetical protein